MHPLTNTKPITRMSIPELVQLYNRLVRYFPSAGQKEVESFSTVKMARTRLKGLMVLRRKEQIRLARIARNAKTKDKVVAIVEKKIAKRKKVVTTPVPEPVVERPAPVTPLRKQRLTDCKPPGTPLRDCLIGSKQALMVDMLSRPEGVTMEELLANLGFGRRPWRVENVRSAFGWDMKKHGYGVRSTIGTDGLKLYHLVVPDGMEIPPHRERKTLLQVE